MELPEQDRQALIEAARRRGVTGKGGAAFGVMPSSGKRPEKLNASRDVNMPAQLARGWAAGTLGLPGDIESLGRMGINLVKPGAVAEESFLPTSEFYQEYLPGGDERPAAKFASGLGALGGGMGSTALARGAVKGSKAVGKAIAPKVGEMAQQYMHASGMAPQLTAYHGTPHKFAPEEGAPLGKFKAEKIGTGEGAQAYGHGIYFAESPGVAKEYAVANKGRAAASEGAIDRLPEAMQVEVYRAMQLRDGPFKQAAIDDIVAKYPEAKEVLESKQSNLYTVDIHDEMIPRMLDWDKPLKEQDIYKSGLLREIAEDAGLPIEYSKPALLGNRTGEDLYHALGAAKGASDYLKSWKVPGIKYLDSQSRGPSGTGKWRLDFKDGTSQEFNFKPNDDVLEKMGATATPIGTRNFVVFPGEEEKVKILERKAEGGLVTDTDAIAAKLKSTGMDDQKAFMQALRMADARLTAHP
jgi:hypothetical protein